MKNNQNVIIAIALSLLVIIGWQYFVIGPKLEIERQKQAAQQQAQTTTPPAATAPGAPATTTPSPAAPAVPGATPAPGAAAPAAVVPRETALASSDRVKIDTPSLKGSINLVGGRIDDLLLADYHVTVERTSPLVELFSPAGTEHPYYAEFGWLPENGGPAVPSETTHWTAEGGPLSPGKDVTLTWDNGAGLLFTRTYSVDAKYMFTVRQSVANNTGAPVALRPFGVVNRLGLPQTAGYYILHEGPIGILGGKLVEVGYDHRGGFLFFPKRNLEDEPTINFDKTNDGWLGITDKYWASALIPKGGKPFEPHFLKGSTGSTPFYLASFVGDSVTIPAGQSAAEETLLFAGAKETNVIDAYQADKAIPLFNRLIDWGWFHFITRPLFKLIDWLYRFLGNFGLAILAVTVLVKLAFFPLANRSYASMTKMKKLQPEMQKLQEQYKDDRMALQQQMMQLYKREKVNPVAGCWPIMIQIPVFFALYKVLFVTIEMSVAAVA